MGPIVHTSWNPLFSLNDIKRTFFGVIEYTFPNRLFVVAPSQRWRGLGMWFRSGLSLALIIYLLEKNIFTCPVVQPQFLWFQVNHVKISVSHPYQPANLSSYYLGRNPPPLLKSTCSWEIDICCPAQNGLLCKYRSALLGVVEVVGQVSYVHMNVCVFSGCRTQTAGWSR